MALQITPLRPGILVALSTSVTGNTTYQKREIEADHTTADGTRRAVWETERTISDPEEEERAQKIRSKARSIISAVCASSSRFGLLCPESRRAELENALAEARALASDFNATARLTSVNVYAILGKVAADDAEALRGISAEMRSLLDEMERGVRKLDVEAIRKAANAAREMGQMLSDNAKEAVQEAIETARKVARDIVKAGETAAAAVDEATIRKITEARTAFLDLEEPEADIGTPEEEGRGIDFEPQPETTAGTIMAAPVRQAALEFI